MNTLRIGVLGAGGRMGSAVCEAVLADPALQLVAAIDPHHSGIDLDQLGIHGSGVQIGASIDQCAAAGIDVLVDFTTHDAALANLAWCAEHGVHAVVGTTGFGADDLADLHHRFSTGTANAVIAPNFAIGAVLMMRFAEMAAPYFETAEIIELHHDAKADAPSGTAMLTAQRIADASSEWAADPTRTELLLGARGGLGPAGIRVHAVRMRGMVAHQEVMLGTTGQTLSIRHDSYDRSSFMPGVLLAIKAVPERPGLTVGLDALL